MEINKTVNQDNNKKENNFENEEVSFPFVDDPEDSGSTALRWCFTQMNYENVKKITLDSCNCKLKEPIFKSFEEVLREFAIKYCDWMIYGHETCPKTGNKHLQGGFILRDRKSLKSIKRLNNNELHLEKMKKHPMATYHYCIKEDKTNYFEHGSDWFKMKFKKYFNKPKKSNSERYLNAIKSAKENDFQNIDPEVLIKNFGNLLKIRDMWYKEDVVPNLFLGGPYGDFSHNHFLWLYGGTGTLKSYNAHIVGEVIYHFLVEYCQKRKLELPKEELYKNAYKKKLTKWWNNYKFQKVVIIEEATKDFVKNYMSHIKIWFDQYAFPAEYKGGEIGLIRPEFIIVTSNYSLDDCFRQEGIDYEKDYLPIKRRIREVHFEGNKKYVLHWPFHDLLRIEYDLKKENELYKEEVKKCIGVIHNIEGQNTRHLIPNSLYDVNSNVIKELYGHFTSKGLLEEDIIKYSEYCKKNNIEIKSAYFKRIINKYYETCNSQNNNDMVIIGEKRTNDSVDETLDVNNKKLRSNNSEESSSKNKPVYFDATEEELKNYVYEENKPIPSRYKFWSLLALQEKFGKKNQVL